MAEWLLKIANDPAAFAVVAAWFTAAASLGVALITIVTVTITARTTSKVVSRSVYINSVTAERSKWIDALRKSIADYSGAAERVISRRKDPQYEASTEWATDVQSIRTHLSNLKLRLNPREATAQNLIDAARKVYQAARIHRWSDVDLASEILVRHGQWVLKFEWNRVKLEAASGNEKKRLEQEEAVLEKEYQEFLKHDGSLDRLKAIGAGKRETDIVLLRSEMDIDVPDAPPKV